MERVFIIGVIDQIGCERVDARAQPTVARTCSPPTSATPHGSSWRARADWTCKAISMNHCCTQLEANRHTERGTEWT